MSKQQTAPLTNAEHLALIARLEAAERLYKVGDVDKIIDDHGGSSRTRWAFEEELNDLSKYESLLHDEMPSWFYKFKALRAEAKDYFDTATLGDRLDLYQLGQELFHKLPERFSAKDTGAEGEERKKVKNIIRVIVAGLEYLHATSDFTTAITYAQRLEEYVKTSGLATKKKPAYGTRAVISYFLGRTHRQRGIDDDYQQAIDYFYQCSEFYFEMARQRDNPDDVIYARTRAMVSLAFGAGFLFYNAQSDLSRAKALTGQARLAFLKDDGTICCRLHYHYLELLYASILRAEAGEISSDQTGEGTQDEEERADAEDKLKLALKLLEEGEEWLRLKPKYYTHVLYNKALIYLYRGPKFYATARKFIDLLTQKCQDNPRWLANALILKSHLERRVGNADGALADAMRAYNQAGSHLPIRIEALLARGQAQFARDNLAAARGDFEKAFELNNGANKKLDSMALILLVRTAIAQERPQQARERFAQIKAIIPSIRHGFILNKYRELEGELESYQSDFVIPSDVEDLDYQKHETALRSWLLEKSLREDDNLTRVAERLKVSKKTIYQWRDTYKVKV